MMTPLPLSLICTYVCSETLFRQSVPKSREGSIALRVPLEREGQSMPLQPPLQGVNKKNFIRAFYPETAKMLGDEARRKIDEAYLQRRRKAPQTRRSSW